MSFSDVLPSLKENDPAPLYLQLQRILRDAILQQALTEYDALPTERDLARDYGLSRITVRKALDGLVEEGLVTRRRGAGTFVASRVEKNFSILSSFSEDMRSRGRRPHSVWISRAAGTVSPEEAMSLSLSPGSRVYRFQRVRYADDTTMALEISTIPDYCLPSLECVGDSLYDALEQAGYRPLRALQRLRAVSFTAEQAGHLGIATGASGLFIERRGFLRDGRAAEYTQSYYRGDAYDVVAELTTMS